MSRGFETFSLDIKQAVLLWIIRWQRENVFIPTENGILHLCVQGRNHAEHWMLRGASSSKRETFSENQIGPVVAALCCCPMFRSLTGSDRPAGGSRSESVPALFASRFCSEKSRSIGFLSRGGISQILRGSRTAYLNQPGVVLCVQLAFHSFPLTAT